MKKFILFGTLLALLFGGIFAYYEYNRKPKTAAEIPVDFTLSADDLVKAFANEEEANQKYNQKILEVTGVVSEISPNEKNYDVLLETSDPMSGVNVHLIPEETEKAKSLKPGHTISLRGKCTGKLSDVELNVGVITKSN